MWTLINAANALGSLAEIAQAQSGSSSQTLTGRVVDIDYYALRTNDKRDGFDQSLVAARASVKWEGMPAGLVTSDGKAYQITGGLAANNNDKIIEFLGKTVTITGQVFEQGGVTMLSADAAKLVDK